MAETAVNIVINKLIPLLAAEVRLQRGVKGEIGYIKNQLRQIQAFLKDADARAEMRDASVEEWVRQVREVAFRMEDVVDEYLFRVAKQGQRHGRVGHLLKSIVPRHKISDEIGEIKKDIARLIDAKDSFVLNPSALEPNSHHSAKNGLRWDAHFMEDDELVGIERTSKKLTDEWLLNTDNRRRTIISVVGEGGLGKTTFVSKIYKKQKEKRSFDCYAWITLSRTLKEENLLKSMLQSLHEEDNDKFEVEKVKDERTQIRKLREYLQKRRYLIVFDNVWDTDFWKAVEYALPDAERSSRIIITTRNQSVAEFCDAYAPSHIHPLEPLPFDDALKLFCIKALSSDVEGCPRELIRLSQDFTKKCRGVPLSISAIAGLLSTKKKNASEWQKVYDSLQSKLASDPHLGRYKQVLSESYNDLPCHLKSCLLYFGLFPESCSIWCVRLFKLWVSEGFIKEEDNENKTFEEVAEEYLGELIRRCLVKVSKVYSYGEVRNCRVHDLMHEFILEKCKKLNFCQLMKNEKCGNVKHEFPTRRLSIGTNKIDADDLKRYVDYGKLRSFFIFNSAELPRGMLESLLSNSKLLVVLDFEDAPLDYLPESVGNLLHLKYLSLRNTRVKFIPKFIGKLQNLETLDLINSLVQELPEEINKLLKLRLLKAYSFRQESHFSATSFSGVKLKEGIGRLSALQELSRIDISDKEEIIEELKNLKELRRLRITQIRRQNGKLLCNAIESMKHLLSLSIDGAEKNEVVDLHSLNEPPQTLQFFYLRVRIEKLPMWITKLKNLVELNLIWSGLTEDPLPVLKELSELISLSLQSSYEGDKLFFKAGWFKKMKMLDLRDLHSLRDLKVDKTALPSLEHLKLSLCPRLVDVPLDIQNLKALKELWLGKMPDQLIKAMKWHNAIKNIPIATYSKGGRRLPLRS